MRPPAECLSGEGLDGGLFPTGEEGQIQGCQLESRNGLGADVLPALIEVVVSADGETFAIFEGENRINFTGQFPA